MKLEQKKQVKYKREKNKVEINGDSNHVYWQIWFDLVTNKLLYFFLLFVLVFCQSPSNIISFIIMYLKSIF